MFIAALAIAKSKLSLTALPQMAFFLNFVGFFLMEMLFLEPKLLVLACPLFKILLFIFFSVYGELPHFILERLEL